MQNSQQFTFLNKDETYDDKSSLILFNALSISNNEKDPLSTTDIYRKMFALADERMQYNKSWERINILVDLIHPLIELI